LIGHVEVGHDIANALTAAIDFILFEAQWFAGLIDDCGESIKKCGVFDPMD
jgi:hypothetical protein